MQEPNGAGASPAEAARVAERGTGPAGPAETGAREPLLAGPAWLASWRWPLLVVASGAWVLLALATFPRGLHGPLVAASIIWLLVALPALPRRWFWASLVGLVGWWAVVLTRSDPGITSDEPFNVLYGDYFVSELLERGSGFFAADAIDSTFALRSEHPPLGRWAIGWMRWALPPPQDDPSLSGMIRSARVAPATAFAVMLVLVTLAAASRHGTAAGLAAGLALLIMPRPFAHAHFAALDTMMSCAYLAAVLSAAWMMEGRRPWARVPVAGFLLGCALLTKLHGILLLPLVGVWAVASYRWRGILSVLLWALAGIATFFAGWPWLWSDITRLGSVLVGSAPFQARPSAVLPQALPRLLAFVSSGVDRQPIYVSYLAHVYRDSEVPWHYPWVLFALTVPVGLHLLGVWGLADRPGRGRLDARTGLFAAAIVLPLAVFSAPRVPVYDGVRLFLIVFPLWAVFVGRGAGRVFAWLRERWGPMAAGFVLIVFFACQSYGVWHYHPFQLSYYNLIPSEGLRHPGRFFSGAAGRGHYAGLLSGLRGAAGLGFEITYWGDAVTPGLIDRWSEAAPEGACAVLVPTLHEAQVLVYDTPRTVARRQLLKASARSSCSYAIVYNREAYLTDAVREMIRGLEPLARSEVDGVWLSAVYAVPGARPRPPQTARGVEPDGR